MKLKVKKLKWANQPTPGHFKSESDIFKCDISPEGIFYIVRINDIKVRSYAEAHLEQARGYADEAFAEYMKWLAHEHLEFEGQKFKVKELQWDRRPIPGNLKSESNIFKCEIIPDNLAYVVKINNIKVVKKNSIEDAKYFANKAFTKYMTWLAFEYLEFDE